MMFGVKVLPVVFVPPAFVVYLETVVLCVRGVTIQLWLLCPGLTAS